MKPYYLSLLLLLNVKCIEESTTIIPKESIISQSELSPSQGTESIKEIKVENNKQLEEEEGLDIAKELKGMMNDILNYRNVKDLKNQFLKGKDSDSKENFDFKKLLNKAKDILNEENEEDNKEDKKTNGEEKESKDLDEQNIPKMLMDKAKEKIDVLDQKEHEGEGNTKENSGNSSDEQDVSEMLMDKAKKKSNEMNQKEHGEGKKDIEDLDEKDISKMLFDKFKKKVNKLDQKEHKEDTNPKEEDSNIDSEEQDISKMLFDKIKKKIDELDDKEHEGEHGNEVTSNSNDVHLTNKDKSEINSNKNNLTNLELSIKIKQEKEENTNEGNDLNEKPDKSFIEHHIPDAEQEDKVEDDDKVNEELFEEIKKIFLNSTVHDKLKNIKQDVILPPWKKYKDMIDQVAKNVNEVYNDPEFDTQDDIDNLDHNLHNNNNKEFVSQPIKQEELEKLYNVIEADKLAEAELGPNAGSSATMFSGISHSDFIVVERCEGTSPSINNNCFCTRVKQWSCPEGHFCMAPNFVQKCTKGFYCPKDTFQPSFCCGGYYCPTPSEIKICPEGHFCQEGSIEKRKCFFGNCPQGSKTIRKYEIFIFFVFFLLVVWVGYSLKERQLKFKRLEYDRKFEYINKASKVDNSNNNELNVAKEKPAITFDIEFENLGLKLPNGVEIMKGVTGKLHSGRTCAIMGPSGAGKTTFISLLTEKAKKTEGKIKVNGQEKSLAQFRKLVGFVPQEDVMLRKLNALEVLTHSAMVRLPYELSNEQKNNKVLEYIEYLGLRHVMHSIIGDEEDRGISGGQRKRVNIGMELVAEPAILFLDEPTSGLDSSTSVEVCSLLKNIARDKKLTIAAVIHSPSPIAFNEFDDLLLLGKGGRVIYHGPVKEALNYFDSIGFSCPSNCSPSDYYMDVATGKILNSKIQDFSVPDLYIFWEMYEKSKQNNTLFNINHMVETSNKLSNYSPNYNPMVSPTASSIDSEEGLVSINKTSIDDMNGKDKHITCLQSTCTPNWRQFLNNIIGPIIQYIIILILDILSWVQSVIKEFYETLTYTLNTIKGVQDPVRNTPGFFNVFILCLNRAFIQIFRPPLGFISDQLLHFGCGLFISIAAQNSVFLGPLPDVICNVTPLMLLPKCKRPVIDQAAQIGNFLSWGIGFAGISVGAGTFGNERTVYWREASSGMATLPYFVAKCLADIPRILIAALMFTCSLIAVYPNSSDFSKIYWIVAALYYWGFSTGYFISALVRREKASLVGVVVALFWAIACSGVQPTLRNVKNDWGPNILWLFDISAPRWAIAAFYIAETEAKGYMDIDKIGQKWFGYMDDTYTGNLINVLKIGFLWQLLAFIAFKLANRDKMQ